MVTADNAFHVVMRLSAVLLVATVACGDAGSVCEPSAASLKLFPSQPGGVYEQGLRYPIALGGSLILEVREDTGFGGRHMYRPWNHAFQATVVGSAIHIEQVAPPSIQLSADAVGASKVNVVDCDGSLRLQDYEVSVAPMGRVFLAEAYGFDTPPPGPDVAFAAGMNDVSVALSTAGPTPIKLVDSSMHVTVDGAEPISFDTVHLPNALPGMYDVDVTVAGGHMSLPLVVTDHAEMVVAVDPPTTIAPSPPSYGVTLCFSAIYQGWHVANFDWRWVIDGEVSPGHGPINCQSVYTTKTSGTFVVTASAGGQSATVTMAVQP